MKNYFRVLNHVAGALLTLITILLTLAFGGFNVAQATTTDIAPAPIFTSTTATNPVKPNIMFVLDDSGSMDNQHMPDDANSFSGKFGFASNHCNGVYYNPNITYHPPVNSLGVSYPNSSFTSAWNDGYNTGSGSTDLSTNFSTSGFSNAAAFYYKYSGTQTTERQKDYYNNNSIFYKECKSATNSAAPVDGTHPVNTLFTKVIVSATSWVGPAATKAGSTDERTNFANWYSYYRTRMLMMKTQAGQAFNTLDDSYRIGFMTINNNVSPDFLNISDFNGTQKANWYTKLYEAEPNNSTPLRESLSNIGRIYAGKVSSATTFYGTTVTDPVQYACQQNYTILSTDGYWNGNDGFKLDGSTAVGNQDGNLERPFYDGSTVAISRSTSQLQQSQTQLTQNTSQLQKKITQVQSKTEQLQQKTTQLQQKTTQLQKRTVQNQSSTTRLQKRTQRFRACATSTSTSGCSELIFDCSSGTGITAKPFCRAGTDSGWSNAGSCTPGGSNPVTFCRTTGPTLANVGTCTPATIDSSGKTISCQVASDTNWVNVGSCSSSNPSSGPTVTCQTPAASWVNVGSCTPAAINASGQTVTCQTPASWVNVGSCTPAAINASGQTVTCETPAASWVNASTCTPAAINGSGVTTSCQTTDTGWVGANSCTSNSTGGQTTTCTTESLGPTAVASCSCVASAGSSCTTPAAAGNSYLQTTCSNNIITAAAGVASCTADAPTIANNFISTNCNSVTSTPTSVSSCTPAAATSTNNYTATICSVGSVTGGTSDTLSDVAAYYYNTNLRTTALSNCSGPVIAPATTASNLCLADKVKPSTSNPATYQHMTTYTIGLGTRGRMVYSPSYLDANNTDSDYRYVAGETTKDSTTCSWADTLTTTGGLCNWPVPGSNKVENIDDLWHAAVNGHGTYLSATDPDKLQAGLASIIQSINNDPKPGAAAATSTTSPKITSTNAFQFSSYFLSLEWSGELIRQSISLVTNDATKPYGSVPKFNPLLPDPATYDWSAQLELDAKTYTTRNIYTKGSSGLIPFTWEDLGTAGLQSNFTTPHITTAPPAFPTQLTGLSQFCATGVQCISAAAQSHTTVTTDPLTNGAAGEALVNFLRGDRSNEEGAITDATKFFRHRTHVLGDIISAQPQYVGPPNKSYPDTGYANFVSNQASRTPIVYAAANDGMLHAFNAANGTESWAYIPSFVVPRLYTLADKHYSDKHQYFVEGTPKSGDVYIGGEWKTILVGGLNGGGTGYYALDITDPASPSLLWEFTDANMGFTFGNPEITKLDDGTWVVLLTSGYNNCPYAATAAKQNCALNGTGDGQGHLYVLNAATGALMSTASNIATGAGDATTPNPSGLSKIVAYAPSNNVTSRVYAGDLLGNLWRFNIGTGTGGYSKQLLATFNDASGNAQPVMDRPQVTTFNGKPVIYVGTGRYLGTTDVGNTLQQSFYAVKDIGASSSYGNPRDNTNFIGKTAVDGICPSGVSADVCAANSKVRTVTQNNSVSSDSIKNKSGWYLDFPASSGELAFTDPKLNNGTLNFSTSTPIASSSEVCGSPTQPEPLAMAYMLDYLTGGAVGTGSVIASTLGAGLATAPQIVQLPNGDVIAKYRLSTGEEVWKKVRFGSGANATKRVSWRELVSE
ncbi:MAG: PilC/PilY family type IV pilus protein [Methylococcales bacterium]